MVNTCGILLVGLPLMSLLLCLFISMVNIFFQKFSTYSRLPDYCRLQIFKGGGVHHHAMLSMAYTCCI